MAQNIIEQVMELTERVESAKANAAEHIAAVKRHHKEIYDPMCVAKREAIAEADALDTQLKSLIAANAELFAALKNLGK